MLTYSQIQKKLGSIVNVFNGKPMQFVQADDIVSEE